MNGFNLFAPVSKCVDTNDDGTIDHCTRANGVACTADRVCTGNDINGFVGGNRDGDNNCALRREDSPASSRPRSLRASPRRRTTTSPTASACAATR